MEGKIVKIVSNIFTVKANAELYDCRARGKFRNQKITPIVGDNVIFDEEKKWLIDIKKRKNELIRPVVANIDQALITVSVKEPELDLYLLDKLLCIIEYNNIKPVICFTKVDLLKEETAISLIKDYYKRIGYQVFDNRDPKELEKIFKNKITVFAGQSGSGKSTLLNKLHSLLNLKTNEISKALGRGKHTTRHVELFEIYDGMCADTPGFSSLEFTDMSKSDIRDNMVEFNEFRHLCEYKDCMHVDEMKCAIKDRLGKEILDSRYENYLKFIGR